MLQHTYHTQWSGAAYASLTPFSIHSHPLQPLKRGSGDPLEIFSNLTLLYVSLSAFQSKKMLLLAPVFVVRNWWSFKLQII